MVGDELTTAPGKLIAAMACDLERSPIGTQSRLLHTFNSRGVLQHAVQTVASVAGIHQIILMAPPNQTDRIRSIVAGIADAKILVIDLQPRPEGLTTRIQRGRVWDLVSWRGGAGQWTVFDEDYHPASVAAAAKQTNADHILCVPAHGALLDPSLLSALVHHHLHKNHEMRFTYTPAAPGLCGIILQSQVVMEMGTVSGAGVTPGMLLGYDPNAPTFDTLIRDACMQVDPALSKIQNRFLLDTDRAWTMAEALRPRLPFESAAALALAARDLPTHLRSPLPRELEIELTGRRETLPPGSVPALLRESRGELDLQKWTTWLSHQQLGDDLLVTFAGDGDPLLYPGLGEVLAATRAAGARAICVQTDLLAPPEPIIDAMNRGLIDVLSITCYGDDAATTQKVSGIDGHARVMASLMKLAPVASATATIVVPRLLKVRDTIPQLESFFDKWILQGCWVVIDGPTDRAGSVPFAGVVDMAPPKRRPCRRITDRLLIRANGNAVPCDQDMNDRLLLGNIESETLTDLWLGAALTQLREAHAAGLWNEVTPCKTCREWHRA